MARARCAAEHIVKSKHTIDYYDYARRMEFDKYFKISTFSAAPRPYPYISIYIYCTSKVAHARALSVAIILRAYFNRSSVYRHTYLCYEYAMYIVHMIYDTHVRLCMQCSSAVTK